jgi:hypothetical protein
MPWVEKKRHLEYRACMEHGACSTAQHSTAQHSGKYTPDTASHRARSSLFVILLGSRSFLNCVYGIYIIRECEPRIDDEPAGTKQSTQPRMIASPVRPPVRLRMPDTRPLSRYPPPRRTDGSDTGNKVSPPRPSAQLHGSSRGLFTQVCVGTGRCDGAEPPGRDIKTS